MKPSPVAVFDLDYTLIEGDSEALWAKFMYEHGLVGPEFVTRMQEYYCDYEQGKLDITEYEEYLLIPLAQHSLETMYQLRNEYLEHIQPLIRPSMLERANWHRTLGHHLLLLTASNSFIAQPIAGLLNFTEVICTSIEKDGERYTGKLTGTPAFREGKVKLFRQWLDRQCLTLEGSWGYGDSHNDLPILAMVDHPVAVSPDPILRTHAQNQGWEVLALP